MAINLRQADRYVKQNSISPIHHHKEGFSTLTGFIPELKYLLSRIFYSLSKITSDEFYFEGRAFPYFHHRYNMTWRNDRAVEISLALDWLARHKDKRILEVGNVLSHYVPTQHEVVDRYEIAPQIINQDILDFKPKEPYDGIITISTLEHIGFDEEEKKPEKCIEALTYLYEKCLGPKGSLLATFPHGYNPTLDTAIRNKAPYLSQAKFLQKVSAANKWKEVGLSTVLESNHQKFQGINVLTILKLEKK